jgi:hypothetical protein
MSILPPWVTSSSLSTNSIWPLTKDPRPAQRFDTLPRRIAIRGQRSIVSGRVDRRPRAGDGPSPTVTDLDLQRAGESELSGSEFDPDLAEDAAQAFFNEVIGGAVQIFESRQTGVIAFARLGLWDARNVDWRKLGEWLTAATGHRVVCVADCDWQFDDRCDEAATFVSFDVPGLDPDYRADYRNLVPNFASTPSPEL